MRLAREVNNSVELEALGGVNSEEAMERRKRGGREETERRQRGGREEGKSG